MSDDITVAVGQVWESTEGRDKGRRVRVVSIEDGYANCVAVTKGRATRLDITRMNLRGHWKLVDETPTTELVPAFTGEGAADPFEPPEPYYQRQLVAVGDNFLVDSVAMSLAPGHKPSHEQFSKSAETLKRVNKGVAFWIGDMLNMGDSLFGEEMSQHIEEFGLDEKSVKVYGWVAKNVPEDNRRVAPSFSHCQVVAGLKPPQQRKWLEKAVEGDWSVAKLKTELTAAGEGRSAMRFLLIVDCVTEPKQDKLADVLEKDGYSVTKRSGLKRAKKGKAKRTKKGEVTARGRRPKKMNQRRRVPTGASVVH